MNEPINDIELLLLYINAELENYKEYKEHKSWHTDNCNCQNCKYVEQWMKLPFYKKLIAKLLL